MNKKEAVNFVEEDLDVIDMLCVFTFYCSLIRLFALITKRLLKDIITTWLWLNDSITQNELSNFRHATNRGEGGKRGGEVSPALRCLYICRVYSDFDI